MDGNAQKRGEVTGVVWPSAVDFFKSRQEFSKSFSPPRNLQIKCQNLHSQHTSITNSDEKRSNYSLFSLEMKTLSKLAFTSHKVCSRFEKDFLMWWFFRFLQSERRKNKYFLIIAYSNPFLFHRQDYHVFFMHNPNPNRCLVFDLDTTLPFPTYFHKYVTETFRSDYAVSEDHHR